MNSSFRRISSLPHLPAKVSSLNAERPLTLGGTNRPSCSTPAIHRGDSWRTLLEPVVTLGTRLAVVKDTQAGDLGPRTTGNPGNVGLGK